MSLVRYIQISKLALLLACTVNSVAVIAEDPVPAKKESYTFGIDISHYQGHINWPRVAASDHDIKFVFMRSTMGDDKEDSQFDRNWKKAGESGLIRGAYHYYRPYENSVRQFKNYSRHVTLAEGDFPPILDIEKPSPYGTANLRKGVLNWLRLAEEHYGVKPIIYTGMKFYNDYLKGHLDNYPLWIASYSLDSALHEIDWTFHQFSDELRVMGIRGPVDGNNYRGDLSQLRDMCVERKEE